MTARGRLFAIAAGFVIALVAVSGVSAIGAAETAKPERVARQFLDVYGSFDAKRVRRSC